MVDEVLDICRKGGLELACVVLVSVVKAGRVGSGGFCIEPAGGGGGHLDDKVVRVVGG